MENIKGNHIGRDDYKSYLENHPWHRKRLAKLTPKERETTFEFIELNGKKQTPIFLKESDNYFLNNPKNRTGNWTAISEFWAIFITWRSTRL